MTALNYPEAGLHDHLLKILVSDRINKLLQDTSTKIVDLNFDRLKQKMNHKMPVGAMLLCEYDLKKLAKNSFLLTIEENTQILKDYIELCLANDVKPVGVVFPFAPVIQKNIDAELLSKFRIAIHQFEENYDFTCVDLFDMNLGYDCFYNLTHLNLKGAALASSLLALKLWKLNLIDTESFCGMSPEYFQTLSTVAPADEYNALMDQVAKVSDKIGKPS